MITITIRFGATNEITKQVNAGTRVSDVLSNTSYKAALGFGDNVQAVIDGSVQSNSTTLNDGDVVVIETKANSKA